MLLVVLMLMLVVLICMLMLMLAVMLMLRLMFVVLVIEVMVHIMVDSLEKQDNRRKWGTEKFWKNGAFKTREMPRNVKSSLDSGKAGQSKK